MSSDRRRPALSNQVQLPFWPDDKRGAPNTLLRSAFFAGVSSKQRKMLGSPATPTKRVETVSITSQDGIDIRFAGVQLNQYDADVFFEATHRASTQPLGTECVFEGAEFLRAIGRTDSPGNYEDLDQSLDRQQDCRVEVDSDRAVYRGSLISSYTRDKETRRFHVTFRPEILKLFAHASYTQLEWQQRRKLKGKPLALWMHSYFSTHAAPFPVSIAFLHKMTGSSAELKHFKEYAKEALGELETIGWTATVKKDRVTIVKEPSKSQGRHIERKVQRAKRIAQEKRMLQASAAAAKRPKRGDGGLSPIGSEYVSDLLSGLKVVD